MVASRKITSADRLARCSGVSAFQSWIRAAPRALSQSHHRADPRGCDQGHGGHISRSTVEETWPSRRLCSPNRHVSLPRADRSLASGNSPSVRRPRPHHSPPRLQEGPKRDPHKPRHLHPGDFTQAGNSKRIQRKATANALTSTGFNNIAFRCTIAFPDRIPQNCITPTTSLIDTSLSHSN